MPKTDNAREFVKLVKDYSQSDINDKSIVGNLSSELTNKKFDWSQPIHDHVTEMVDLTTKLNAMEMEVSESFLVQFILNSFPAEFGQFQVNHNTLKEKWNFQEIKAILIQEERRLKKMKDNSIHLMAHDGASTSKIKLGKKGKGKFNLRVKDGGVGKEKSATFVKRVVTLRRIARKEKKMI